MAARTAAELVIDVVTNAGDATAGFDNVSSSAGGMERAIKSTGDTAERTSRQIGISADAADDLGGKAGKATGALGALSSGFELVGAEKYAGALQGAGLATDFMSGVGDSLNLVMESTIVKTGLAKLAMVGHAIASGASAAATGVMTAAQWALNAAMNANPIGLVVLAIIALVAIFVVAYKHSATFRAIVTGAFEAVQRVAGAVVGWIRTNWPLLLAILTGPIGLAVLAITKNWDKISAGAKAVLKAITGAFSDAGSWLLDAGKQIVQGLIDGIGKMIGKLVDKLKGLTDLIPKIKGPADKDRRLLTPAGQLLMEGLIAGIEAGIPDLRRTLAQVTGTVADVQPQLDASLVLSPAGSSSSSGVLVAQADAGPTYSIVVNGALDPVAVANQIGQLLDRRARRL